MIKRLSGIRRAATIIVGVAACGTAGMVPTAHADAVFHTERIPLQAVGQAPLHDGFVVDIHANGPEIYALERYVLNGAAPNTTYQVTTWLYTTDSCTSLLLPTGILDAPLTTNVAGNGEAGHLLTPADVQPLRQMGMVYVIWRVLNGNATAYQTGCTTVTLD